MNELFVICYFDSLPRSLWRKEKKETSLAFRNARIIGWMDTDGRTDGRMNDEGVAIQDGWGCLFPNGEWMDGWMDG